MSKFSTTQSDEMILSQKFEEVEFSCNIPAVDDTSLSQMSMVEEAACETISLLTLQMI